jgi:putative transposase
MARIARVVLAETSHHVTQRGVDRQSVFFSDVDRRVYLELLQHSARQFRMRLLGYCLMSNHVHWIVIPSQPDSLAKAFGDAHGRYAHYANALRNRSGHFWQNRFFSCALETSHLWAALRYVERNPLRAGLVAAAEEWPWSSAAARTGSVSWPDWLDVGDWRATFTAEDWRSYLGSAELTEAELRLRINTYTGRPAGSAAFLARAEATLCRRLEPRKGGRPRKVQRSGNGAADPSQAILFSDV